MNIKLCNKKYELKDILSRFKWIVSKKVFYILYFIFISLVLLFNKFVWYSIYHMYLVYWFE